MGESVESLLPKAGSEPDALLQRIAAQSTEFMLACDLELQVTAFNPALQREVKRRLDIELQRGMPLEQAFALSAAESATARALLRRALAGEVTNLVAPFGRTPTLYEITVGALRADDGTPEGLWALGRDVDAREAESALERERLRTVLELLPVGVWIADASGRFVARNQAGRDIWGEDAPMSERPEDYGTDYRGWWPDGRQITSDEWGLARALRGATSSAEEIEIERRDGTRRTVLNYALPIRTAGDRLAGAVALNVDITERKQYERAYQFLAQASTLLTESIELDVTLQHVARLALPYLADYCVVDLLDTDGRVRRVAAAHADPAMQPVVEELLRYPPPLAAEGIVSRVLRSSQPLIVEHVPAIDAAAAAGGNDDLARVIGRLDPHAYMCLPMCIRGTTLGAILLALSGSGRRYGPLELQTGQELARRAAAAVDNARHYAAEEAARQVAEAASRAKSQFLATMSHELRTPLTGIIGYTELLDEEVTGPLTPAQKQQLGRIKTSAWHLVTIIDEILLFARAEAGREQVRLGLTDLVALMQESVAIVEPQARAKGLELTATSTQPEVLLETDQGKVRQILLNLIGNAVKFTDRGRVAVELEHDAASAWITVHDTGPGIPPSQLERIFDAFTQADSSTTRTKGGAGLGLTVSRRLAELLGGTLTAESRGERGSTFVLRLPRYPQGL